MLLGLSIRDVVLIDRLDMAFQSGLSVLTGETGAGKSILLDAFALALGSRGDGSLVRAGQASGQVTAAFDPRFGEAWTRAQCIGILAMPGVWLTLARVGEAVVGFALSRAIMD